MIYVAGLFLTADTLSGESKIIEFDGFQKDTPELAKVMFVATLIFMSPIFTILILGEKLFRR